MLGPLQAARLCSSGELENSAKRGDQFEALALVLQATGLCAGGKTVLEPVAIITRDCSNMWHVLKVQLIPYYMGLRDHGMEDRRMQLLLLEKPDCHPVSLSEKDHFMPLFKVLSAGPPLTGKALPEVRLAFCLSAALVCHTCTQCMNSHR
jgi:hypothetical protein